MTRPTSTWISAAAALEAKLQNSEGMVATLAHVTQTLRDTLDDTQSQAARHLCDLADSFTSQRSENQQRPVSSKRCPPSPQPVRKGSSERRHLAITDAHNDNMQRLAVAWSRPGFGLLSDYSSPTTAHQTTAAIEAPKHSWL